MDTSRCNRTQGTGLGNKYLRRLLGISYMKNNTKEYVRNMKAARVGPQEPFEVTVK
ncbi:hypothetical protein DPMN_065272 [Dreissena polymorpha]|uniref:Uncharacterized protein n=1 Tax=Dreissena polymorpha TaxID=45954 RepID=A0A9D4HK65_DREPO|nr:hypothetical protein DPMN_065272 [Dreissena polymorpha]